MLIQAAIALTIVSGYSGHDACFNWAHVVTHAPGVQSIRQQLDDRFRPRYQALEFSRERYLALQQGLQSEGTDAALRDEIGQTMDELEADIAARDATLRDDLAAAVEQGRIAFEQRLTEEIEAIRLLLDIGELLPDCRRRALLPDVTDAVLAHLRDVPVM